jgi:hypothetical protein
MDQWRRQEGDRRGLNWSIPRKTNQRGVRHIMYDTNYWKTCFVARIRTAMGDRGCYSLYGRDPEAHRLIAEHMTAEYCVQTEGRGRKVDEWRAKPGSPDNHLFDCAVGTAVAASECGISLGDEVQRTRRKARPKAKAPIAERRKRAKHHKPKRRRN